MKFLGLTLLIAAALGLAVAGFQSKASKPLVGTRPGGVGKSLDTDKAARAQGCELAMFGAG